MPEWLKARKGINQSNPGNTYDFKFQVSNLTYSFRGKPNSEANLNTMNGQQIISHLLAEGHEELDSKLQEKIIDIIKGEIHKERHYQINILIAGLRQGCNPEDDPCHADKVQGTSLRQLLTLCHEHEGGKNFSAEQFAFLHGIVTGLKIAKGK